MWKTKRKLKDTQSIAVRLVLPEAALKTIFDECDGFDRDETGGRVIGTYSENDGALTLRISGIIGAGPQAQRSPVSFFQDGEYQEGVFRHIEQRHPEIEHLGTWHTHHVNGLQTLSGGDITTYHRTVNHQNHNIPFFYALLVTTKHGSTSLLSRYSIKHFLFRRGDDGFFEIPPEAVEIVREPLLWPASEQDASPPRKQALLPVTALAERVNDRAVLSEFYTDFRSFSSAKLGVYWRGTLELLDDSRIETIVVENTESGNTKYSVAIRKPPEALGQVAEELARMEFPTARGALIATERLCNRAIYAHHRKSST
jgi:hypothetical protein